jgi:DNA-directed RNA polymerase subunit M/transcription elongation factor TFIIS
MFCEICGKILKVCQEGENKIGSCACGFSKIMGEISSEETIKKQEEKGVGFNHDKNELATFPHECTHCGHDLAQVIELGVWYSDEAGNIRYKCGKCGRVEGEKGNNS